MNSKLPTVGLLVIRERKLLLAFSMNKKAYYLPGGKLLDGESARSALHREIREELNVELSPDLMGFYAHVSAPAYGEADNVMMEQDCFFCDLKKEPMACSEISDLAYFDSKSFGLLPVRVPGVVMIMDRLRTDGLIS